MAGRNLIKKLKALILVRVPLETLPTNGKNLTVIIKVTTKIVKVIIRAIL